MSPKSTQKNERDTTSVERPPVVVVMGHVDHGKSKLLDYIRKTNIVEKEAGGITQRLSAYEVVHTQKSGVEKKITFLDTPGHAAFQKMRHRGAEVADIAILIVSAEEGVKAQTLEALNAIKESGIPYLVAINKIDKPTANIEKTKQDLIKNEIYLEGLGGDIPWGAISAKEGTGVSDLLDLVLLVAEMQELLGDPSAPAEGVVIETHRNPQKGMSATLIVKNGTVHKGEYVVSGHAIAPVRIMENFLGNPIDEAAIGSPVQVIGFDTLPAVGAPWRTAKNKKEARGMVSEKKEKSPKEEAVKEEDDEKIITIPLIIKADVSGSLDAILDSVANVAKPGIRIKVVHTGVGDITEGDIKMAGGKEETAVIGFAVGVESSAKDIAERLGISISTFDIIYKVTEWLEELCKKRAPKLRIETIIGKIKILKTFSATKYKQVVGGTVLEGAVRVKSRVRIMRRDTPLGEGVIRNLQQQKVSTNEIREGNEFGMEIESKVSIAAGDILENFLIEEK